MATGRNILSGVVTQEAIKKLCYHKIEAAVPSSIDWDNVIGQGTYGIILGTIHEPNWVVKVANHTKQCAVMDHEHDKNLERFQIAQIDALFDFQ
jgi:hypothetical protein